MRFYTVLLCVVLILCFAVETASAQAWGYNPNYRFGIPSQPQGGYHVPKARNPGYYPFNPNYRYGVGSQPSGGYYVPKARTPGYYPFNPNYRDGIGSQPAGGYYVPYHRGGSYRGGGISIGTGGFGFSIHF